MSVQKVEAHEGEGIDDRGWTVEWLLHVPGPGTYYIVPEELVEHHEPFSLDYRGRIAIIEEGTE